MLYEVITYRHWLENIRAGADYALSEEVEQVIHRKDLSGKDAFVQLFDELSAGLSYRFRMPGEERAEEPVGVVTDFYSSSRVPAALAAEKSHAISNAHVLSASYNFV